VCDAPRIGETQFGVERQCRTIRNVNIQGDAFERIFPRPGEKSTHKRLAIPLAPQSRIHDQPGEVAALRILVGTLLLSYPMDRNAGVRIYESNHGVKNGKIGTGAGSPVLSSKP